MDAPDNKIGAAGAAALVEGLKEMTNLTQLNLSSECCMVGIVCQVAVMSWIQQVYGVHTGKGQGARGIMMWVWLQKVDLMGARAWLFGLQGMITGGMLGDGSEWYGHVRHCGVSTPHSHSHSLCV